MTLFPTSIRARLTLTAVTVMGVLFILLGAVVEVVGRQEIMNGVDADLLKRASETIQLHKEMQRNMPPPPGHGGPDDRMGPDGPGGPRGPGGPDGPFDAHGRGGPGGPDDRPRLDRGLGPRFGGPDGRGPRRGPNDGPDTREFQRAVAKIGDPLLAIGPRFISITPGPPFASPDRMVAFDPSVVSMAERHGVVYSMVMLGNEKVRLITKLAVDDNGRKWLVQYPYPLGDIDKALRELSQTLLILLPIGLILTAIACLFLVKRIMRPIREITLTAESIGADDLTGRLTVSGADEFAHLAGTMNGMLSRIEIAFAAQGQAMEKLEAILKKQRRFTADASHELKTPLAVIKANTGLMLHGMQLEPDVKGSVTAIDSAATRMNRLVQGLMVLARAESGQSSQAPKLLNLVLVAQNAIDQVHRSATKSVIFSSDFDELWTSGCESDIERVVVNLVDNACRHTRDDGHIHVSAGRHGGNVVVTVADDGEGIATEHIEHIFDRFYRVDSARSTESGGSGLGLAICKGIVEAHGGNLSLSSELEKGTTVTFTLPEASGSFLEAP